ncbi:MAG: PD-(D/E)XK nuclease family transposase [bacterium]
MWIYFIAHAGDLETIPEKLDEPVFHKAFDLANRANMTSKELDAYDASITVMLDERGRIAGAYEKGEQNKAYEITRSMKQKNMKANLIAELTGLSVRKIERLD